MEQREKQKEERRRRKGNTVVKEGKEREREEEKQTHDTQLETNTHERAKTSRNGFPKKEIVYNLKPDTHIMSRGQSVQSL